jgi:transaldolase
MTQPPFASLPYSIEHGAVGTTCNPVIVLGVLKQEIAAWKDRIRNLIESNPASGEDDLPRALGAQM